tara:strand:+ start:26 stop:187 length:162 start_codon:yes stop_codon:yes gene_type:complete
MPRNSKALEVPNEVYLSDHAQENEDEWVGDILGSLDDTVEYQTYRTVNSYWNN